ncbi:hypothetical protein LBMAG14_01450 [Actinomycetes bacterium]|nr:hypothetical protein LBMAG14_01450 [Actinomycetes bacterium]
MCGGFAVAQLGHTDLGAGLILRLAERRLWVFDREVLRFGTATLAPKF